MPSATHQPNSDNETSSGSEGYDNSRDQNYRRFSEDENVEELESEDFPGYFNEVGGRLYHSSPTCPYPLPVDGREQERLNALISLVYEMMGANYVGPVPDILSQGPEHQAQVLDLCTGTGTWLMDIAREFPSVLFTGVDIVPIATRYPLPNVNFEIGDIAGELRWSDATFDFVNARSISWSVRDYSTILPEVIRIMRVGGLFFSGELDTRVFFSPDTPEGSNPEQHPPASTEFFRVVNDAARSIGIRTIVDEIPDHLRNTGAFENIEARVIYIPIGTWHEHRVVKEMGRAFRAILGRFAESVKPFLRSTGHEEEAIDLLTQNFGEEMDTARLVGAYHIVHAIKSSPA